MDKEKLTNTLSENAVLVRMTAKHPSGIRTDKRLKRDLAIDTEVSSERLLGVSKHIYGEKITNIFATFLISLRMINTFFLYTFPSPPDLALFRIASFSLKKNKNTVKYDIF